MGAPEYNTPMRDLRVSTHLQRFVATRSPLGHEPLFFTRPTLLGTEKQVNLFFCEGTDATDLWRISRAVGRVADFQEQLDPILRPGLKMGKNGHKLLRRGLWNQTKI